MDLAKVLPPLPVRRRLLVSVSVWLRRHGRSLAVLVPVLVVAGLAHAIGMSTFPRYVDDPGTYLSQAWSLRYQGTLSPYSYFYDHAPAGWIQMALWALLTNGFDRYGTAFGFGNEVMLLAKLASTALVYALGRRLGFSRAGGAGAALLFALCPLSVSYGRWVFLDNLATPWLLGAFVLALSPRRGIAGSLGAALCFGMAALTKETALVLLPALAWAMWRNADPRNRTQTLTVAAGAGVLLMALYPLFALYKGELFPGPGHNSLLGTAGWQLAERPSSGSVLLPDTAARHLFTDWLTQDWILLLGGLAALPVCLAAPRLRPIALALALGWLVLLRGGYVPFMHVLTLLPWAVLLVVGAIEVVAGNRRPRTWAVEPETPARHPRWRLVMAGGLAIGVLAAAAAVWPAELRPMLTTTEEPPLRAAQRWVADNVPRDKVIVAHDSIWVDLVHHNGYNPRPIIVHKLDTDPAVRRDLTRIDYLVVPNWYYTAQNGPQGYPTLLEARKHAVAVTSFGTGDDGVTVYRVSRYWEP
ncbi:MAG TPA: hypothetical protein VGX25_05660 [Actinophytocola sp.]|uniref:glycosyltransferase family 39 protein n=1 Tax=Actinophytocola sp. TaxID=1872138 RepID=UPI002DDD0E98|nr:hypothetical protein [Actinophytocola sp.]HEV2778870.1 hypothetical protein [Actinophytocola sp.]